MGRKSTKYITIPDFKEQGNWVKSKSHTNEDGYLYKVTTGYVLWNSINKRCNTEAEMKKGRNWYLKSENHFEDFQVFVDWCQMQYGYNEKDEKGNTWQLDKDILILGNKIYSPETCMFVPSKINSLLLSSESVRGQWPVGVYFNKRCQRFVSQVNDSGKRKSLGYFNCPMDAHRAWQSFKISKLLEESGNTAYGNKLCTALRAKAAQIENAMSENRETILGVNA